MSLTGALTPAGLGMSCLIPLIEAGFVDWIVSTGANLYHDTHFALGLKMFQGSAEADDVALRKAGVVRIYDIVFDYRVLLSTDAFFRKIARQEEFQRTMSTAEFHYLRGPLRAPSASACSSCEPIDAGGGVQMRGADLHVVARRLLDRHEPGRCSNSKATACASIRSPTSTRRRRSSMRPRRRRKSAVFILGGGSPKNFMLQTEPQIQEVMGVAENGHDYFLQVTDARPDTGGLSGATPSEAMTWGKIDPDRLPDSVVCYVDSTVALPLITAYALARRKPRKLRRLYEQREAMMARLRTAYENACAASGCAAARS